MGCFDKGKTETKPASLWTRDQVGLLTEGIDYLRPLIGEPGPSYAGERVAELSPLQNQAMQWASGLPGQIGGYQQTATQQLADLTSGRWAQPVVDWTSRLWERDIMPSIMERQASMDAAGSGGTTQALNLGAQDLLLGMSAQLAPLMAQTQMNAIPMYGDVASWSYPAMGQLAGLGGVQYGQEQAELDAAQQAWMEQQPIYSPVWNVIPTMFGQTQENIVYDKPAGMGLSALGGLVMPLSQIGMFG